MGSMDMSQDHFVKMDEMDMETCGSYQSSCSADWDFTPSFVQPAVVSNYPRHIRGDIWAIGLDENGWEEIYCTTGYMDALIQCQQRKSQLWQEERTQCSPEKMDAPNDDGRSPSTKRSSGDENSEYEVSGLRKFRKARRTIPNFQTAYGHLMTSPTGRFQ